MERKFWTLIKKDHKFGENDYIHGCISGFKLLICDGEHDGLIEPGYANYDGDDGVLILTVCEPEQYEQFSNLVERHYPGLCVFDVIE